MILAIGSLAERASRPPDVAPEFARLSAGGRWIRTTSSGRDGVQFGRERLKARNLSPFTDESVANRCAILQPIPDGLAPTVQSKIPTSVLVISPQTGLVPRGSASTP